MADPVSSRTFALGQQSIRAGLWALLAVWATLPAAALAGAPLDASAWLQAVLAVALASPGVGLGVALAHGARHWGAKEPSAGGKP